MASDKRIDEKTKQNKKTKYSKPTLVTESLTAVAAVCNGSTGGGRKATTGAPNFCTSTFLKS